MDQESLENWRVKIIKLARSDLEEALHESEKLIELFPDEGVSWATRSYVRWKSGDRLGAMQDIDRAISKKHEEPSNYFHKADYLLSEGNFENAIESLSLSIEKGNAKKFLYYDEVSHAFRAFCYCQVGMFDEALEDLKHVSGNNPIWIDVLRTKDEMIEWCLNREVK